jgi:hypothetical protein
MKITNIIQNDIAAAYPEIHATRLNTLLTFVNSGMHDQRVSVTYLGRGLKSLSKTTKKNDIKRADRLIGNQLLHFERPHFYEYMTSQLIGQKRFPIILVDWSPINGQEIFQVLRASIPMKGRSLTLYEKIYPESELNTNKAHQEFLDALENILPEGCEPIIVSDAIYRSPWFKIVEEKGWYWIGRVRGQVSLSKNKTDWKTSYQWFNQACVGKAEYIGSIYYGKAAKFSCNATIYKRSSKGRKARKMRGGVSQRTTDKIHEKDAKEPWLLVFKLPEKFMKNAKTAVNLYSQRMQIEENFRDTKNNKLGIGLECANSRSVERFDNLLLVAALILYLLWCIGSTAVMKKCHYSLQANTQKKRMVLSIITIGREIIDDDRYSIQLEEYVYVLSQLSNLTVNIEGLHE